MELENILSEQELESLHTHILAGVAGGRCDHTFHHTSEWMKEHGYTTTDDELRQITGQHCDCEIELNLGV